MVKRTGSGAATAGRGGKPGPKRSRRAMMPLDFLLKVARGEEIGGHVPSFAERMDAAKMVLPYYAPRLSPERAGDEEGKGFTVTVMRFADAATEEPAAASASLEPTR